MSPKERIVKMERTVKAPPERVFAALTDAGRLRTWFCDRAWSEARVGGSFTLRWNSGYEAQGVFVEMTPPEELVMIWQGLGEPGQTLVEWELEETEDGTELELKQSGFGSGIYWDAAYDEAQRGWTMALDNLQSVLKEGIDQRELRRPFLGVYLDEMTPERAQEEGIATDEGIYITGLVEGGAAEEAGVQQGDVLVSLGGREVTGFSTMFSAMQAFRAGDDVEVGLVRGQEQVTVSATLKQREMPQVPTDPAEVLAELRERYGQMMAALLEATAGLSDEDAGRPPAEGQWSVKEVLAHLSGVERWTHRTTYLTAIGQWVEGTPDWSLAPDGNAATLAVQPTLKGLLERFAADMDETVLLIERLPDKVRAEPDRFRRIVTHIYQYFDHTEEHVAQIRQTIETIHGGAE